MTKTLDKRRLGIMSAFGVLFSQGFEAVLIPFIYFSTILILKNNHANSFAASILAIKEVLALIMIILVISPRVFIKAIKRLKNGSAWVFVIAGIVGTSMGNLAFVLGIVLAGSSWGVVLTAFYPIFVIFLNKFFYKEKENLRTLIGILITILSGVAFVVAPILVEGFKQIGLKRIVGITMGGAAGFFWALEGVILRKGIIINKSISTNEIVSIRSITSAIFLTAIYLPLSMLFGNESYTNVYTNIIRTMLKDWRIMIVFLVIAINLILMRIMHTFAIICIGQKLTGIIDTNNFMVPAILALMLQFLPGYAGAVFVESVLDWWMFLILIPLGIGLGVTLMYHNDIHNDKTLTPLEEIVAVESEERF